MPGSFVRFPHISHTGLADMEDHSTDQTDVTGREPPDHGGLHGLAGTSRTLIRRLKPP